MQKPILELRDVCYIYPSGIQALRDINLKIYPGMITAIVGPNGSGKTTLLLICAGLLTPTKGTVTYKGKDVFKQKPLVRKEIGIVFQDPDDQIFNLTVFDEIAFGLRQLRLSEEEIIRRVTEVSKKLGIYHLLSRSPLDLSYGEKKIITLASILVMDPEILILDEPTANLGGRFKRKVIELIYEYKRQGKTVIFSSHDIIFTLYTADYVYVLNKGKILAQGSKDEIRKNLEVFERAELENPRELFVILKQILK